MKASSETTQILVTSANNVLPYIEYCDRHNLEWKTVASEAGLPVEMMTENQWLATKDIMKFLHKLELLYGEKIGIEVGRHASISTLSPRLEKKTRLIRSLDQAIPVLIEEIGGLSNHITIWTEFKEGRWWLCHRSCYRPSNAGFDQAEWFRTLALIKFCQKSLGSNWQPEKAKFVSSSLRKLPKQYVASDIDFGQEYGAFTIPLSDTYYPLPVYDAEPDWFEAVKKLITTYAFLPWFNIEWLAQMLGVTKRTLQRNLKSQGTVFKDVKETARLNKAKELLGHTDLSVQEISWQVGYSDLSNFNRAFKRWTGVTAPSYRKSLAALNHFNANNNE